MDNYEFWINCYGLSNTFVNNAFYMQANTLVFFQNHLSTNKKKKKKSIKV